MRLDALAKTLDAKVIVPPSREHADVGTVSAGDRISDLLAHSGEGTVIVSRLGTTSLIHAAALVDAAAVCLVAGADPSEEMAEMAAEHGVALLVSPTGFDETVERIRQVLGERSGAAH